MFVTPTAWLLVFTYPDGCVRFGTCVVHGLLCCCLNWGLISFFCMQYFYIKKYTVGLLKFTGYQVGGVVSHQFKPPVATAPLLFPCWKQHSIKPVILATITRAGRSITNVDVNLQRMPPYNFSPQKYVFARKIHRRRLWSLCASATSSKWYKFFRLAFTVQEKNWKIAPRSGKNDLVSTSRSNNFLITQHLEKIFCHLIDKAFALNLITRSSSTS